MAPIPPYPSPARSSPGDEPDQSMLDIPITRPIEPVHNVDQPKRPKPFIERAPEPVPAPMLIAHHHYYPATTQLPEVDKSRSEVQRKPEGGSSERPKPEDYSSDQKKKPPKVEEKASKPEGGSSTAGTKNKKGLKFNGSGGRIHTEAHIDRILDEYILTGKLPTYVSDRQRYDYRHHIRLPERRKLLDKQQTGNKASGTSATTGTKDNITHFPGTGTHDS